MSEANTEDTIKIVGARISRKLIPWVIAFIVLMTIVSWLFFGAGDNNSSEIRKQQHADKISDVDKKSVVGTEEGGRQFISSVKADVEESRRKEKAEKDRLELEALDAGKKGDPVAMPMPGKVDPVELEQLKQAREAALQKQGGGSDIGGGSQSFYEDYGTGIRGEKFIPGSGLRDGSMEASGQSLPPEAAALIEEQKKRDAKSDAQRAATLRSIETIGSKSKKPSGQASDAEWQEAKSSKALETTDPIYPTRVSTRHVLFEGSVIPVVLEGEINSELPGRVNGRVVFDIYDSIYGTSLLIPKGSKVMGEYNNSIKDGQDRLMIAFSRIILSDGRSIRIPAMDGADEMGRAGVEGVLDTRFWRVFGPSFLIAGIAQIFKPNPSVTVNNTGAGDTYVDATGQILTDVSKKIIGRYEGAKPILRIEKGARMNIVVTRDMAIPPDGGFAWDASGVVKKMEKK